MTFAASGAQALTFGYTGVIETWVATTTGEYRVIAEGAQGFSADTEYEGGRGARIEGTFTLTAGSTYYIVVGGEGGGAKGSNGGGGGGTFFVSSVDTPLLVAGGGGGTRDAVDQNGTDASITEYAYNASGSDTTYVPTLKTTDLGLGGIASSTSWGSGGAGFYGDGQNDATFGTGGSSWANGMLGGVQTGSSGAAANGGFGGGGAGNGGYGGGGGGGYSGGDGGRVAGGGGSYNIGLDQIAVAGVGYGDGFLSIELLSPVSEVPVPAALPMLAAAICGLGLFRSRRKAA